MARLNITCESTRATLLAWVTAGKQLATCIGSRLARQVRRNLAYQRLFSFPHLLAICWVVVLLWGERWVFDSKVKRGCVWEDWEDWPKQATPHHLVLIADPQIIDPHSYPSRPWPLSALTALITDNYLRRGYRSLQSNLRPDSVFFLGDLFDGGREWKTRQGKFVDPKWGQSRSTEEKTWVDEWHKRYGEDYWLTEYMRFGGIFFDGFRAGGDTGGAWQRGRKLVASLPGNHDLGFGAQVQIPVRDRFEAFFGSANRVDIVGNHSVVSVDTVSLSAYSSEHLVTHDLRPIYEPALQFLENVKRLKKKAMDQELGLWHDVDGGPQHNHVVQDLDNTDLIESPKSNTYKERIDLPTVLLSHVPLFREPGTPCGPYREHWPPAKPPPGQTSPVKPDPSNAIRVSKGYQYQNVLNDADSANLIRKVGNVVHAFSGDDHDYCEVVHSTDHGSVREITVKSNNMAMGVSTPGFLMVSLWNPIDATGHPLNDPEAESRATLQTHLCLLPNQLHTYMMYVAFVVLSLVLLTLRALLVSVLHLTPFYIEGPDACVILPQHRKRDASDHASCEGDRGGILAHNFGSATASVAGFNVSGSSPQWQAGGRRGKSLARHDGLRIRLDEEAYYLDTRKAKRPAAGGTMGAKAVEVVGKEMLTTTWRVTWLATLVWVWLLLSG